VASTTPTTLIAQSPAWAAEGTQLKQGVAGMQSPDGDGDFAYQSLPVDIAADGMYTLDFGPVDSRFNPTPSPGAPFALTYDLPSDAQFKMVVEGGGTLVSLNGEQYYEAQADVTQFVAPYPQFSAWIYS
jgi:hypothetical protein